nr:hypothetical protein [Tanacetum cinerariifolium]
MFKQLHLNITLADALILTPKHQKMLKALLSNKEKLLELANIPLNENCSAVILKKLPEKLRDPRKLLIPCSFSELKCKSLADLVRKFTFPADFVIVDYESDPQVPLILGRPFLRTARALIDVHGEEMILRDALLSDKEKLLELTDTPLNENCSAVILKKLPEKLGDPGKFLIPDVFVPVGKFTFAADFVIVDYESDPGFLLILERPFLQIARALIDVHGEETILRDG